MRSFKMKMMCNILNLSFFFLAFGFVNSQNADLICYDCDPTNSNNAEECQYPDKKNAPTKICRKETNGNNGNDGTNETVIYSCLSTYIQTDNPNTTGIIRDCYAVKPDVENACELFKAERSSKNFTVKSCYSCDSPRCNTKLLFSDGTSGAESNFFFLMVFVNLIFGIIITSSA